MEDYLRRGKGRWQSLVPDRHYDREPDRRCPILGGRLGPCALCDDPDPCGQDNAIRLFPSQHDDQKRVLPPFFLECHGGETHQRNAHHSVFGLQVSGKRLRHMDFRPCARPQHIHRLRHGARSQCCRPRHGMGGRGHVQFRRTGERRVCHGAVPKHGCPADGSDALQPGHDLQGFCRQFFMGHELHEAGRPVWLHPASIGKAALAEKRCSGVHRIYRQQRHTRLHDPRGRAPCRGHRLAGRGNGHQRRDHCKQLDHLQQQGTAGHARRPVSGGRRPRAEAPGQPLRLVCHSGGSRGCARRDRPDFGRAALAHTGTAGRQECLHQRCADLAQLPGKYIHCGRY